MSPAPSGRWSITVRLRTPASTTFLQTSADKPRRPTTSTVDVRSLGGGENSVPILHSQLVCASTAMQLYWLCTGGHTPTRNSLASAFILINAHPPLLCFQSPQSDLPVVLLRLVFRQLHLLHGLHVPRSLTPLMPSTTDWTRNETVQLRDCRNSFAS